MTTVTVLTSRRIDPGRLDRRLARAGYTTTAGAGGVRIHRPADASGVDATMPDIDDLPDAMRSAACELFGGPPRCALACSFDGPAAPSDDWATVVDIARAVAADVPLAVLDDHAGTTYLVHPKRGLVGPDEYRAIPRRNPTADFLRRLLGGT